VRLRIKRNACKAELQVSNTNIGVGAVFGKSNLSKGLQDRILGLLYETLSGSWWEVPAFISPTRMLRAQRRFFVRRAGGGGAGCSLHPLRAWGHSEGVSA
jgi:hypothetical protein